ncbi:pickpocket protein 28-like isoform X2 [Tenebrio molitor]|uniref:pickpocket protein 28-like isoform X2 n=1 Tax=Tenebrio molitor TaxID=7067 RepID=UPI0036249D26
MSQNTISREKSYFKEQYKYIVDDLQRKELEQRQKLQRTKELNMQRRGKHSQLQQYAVEYSYATDIHGIQFLSERRSLCEKIFWIVVVLLSFITCLVMVTVALLTFQNSSVIVSFKARDTPIYEIPFPAVTICPESKGLSLLFTRLEHTLALRGYLNITEESWLAYQYFHILCNRKGPPKLFGTRMLGNDFFEIFDRIRKPLDDIFFRCELFGRTRNCSELFVPTLTEEGLCYTFNMLSREDLFVSNLFNYKDFYEGKRTYGWAGQHGYLKGVEMHTYPARALLSGADNPLRVTLKISKAEDFLLCRSFTAGYRVLLHNPIDIPRPSQHHFLVPMNKFVAIAVEPKLLGTHERVRTMPVFKRLCYMDRERNLRYFKWYSQQNCFLECLTDFLLAKCQCVHFSMPIQLSTLDMETQMSAHQSGYCDCKPLCTDLKFELEMSQSVWNWQSYYENQWGNDVEKERQKLNVSIHEIALLSIYFKSGHFLSVMRHEWHGVPDLLSKVGGYFSLFTGMSMVSIMELIYFLTIRIICNKSRYGHWAGPQ